MSPRIIINRLEINFWNTVIPLMQYSPPVRFIVPRLYAFAANFLNLKSIAIFFMCTITGITLGFVLGLLSQIL